MISKVLFLAALILCVLWAIIFSYYNDSIYINILAVVPVSIFGVSYITRNKRQ